MISSFVKSSRCKKCFSHGTGFPTGIARVVTLRDRSIVRSVVVRRVSTRASRPRRVVGAIPWRFRVVVSIIAHASFARRRRASSVLARAIVRSFVASSPALAVGARFARARACV
jgi:hypothetical protein